MKRVKIIKVFTIFILILSIFVLSGVFINNQYFDKSVAEANSFLGVFDIIGENNPINKALVKEIKFIEEQEFARLEAERINEAIRVAEIERLLESERLEAIEKEKTKNIKKNKGDKNSKIAYLTFDDGPSIKSTYAILDILLEYNIKATFFVVGRMVKNYPEVLLRTVEEGHSIGNHSYSHDYGYLYKSSKNFLKDLNLADQTIKNVLGQEFETKVMRFPGGSHGKKKSPMINAVIAEGYKYYDWNSLNGDAEGVLMSKDYLLNRLKATYKKQSDLIVLMHDTDVKTTTVESLRSIIDFLIEQGYEFGVIDSNYDK